MKSLIHYKINYRSRIVGPVKMDRYLMIRRLTSGRFGKVLYSYDRPGPIPKHQRR